MYVNIRILMIADKLPYTFDPVKFAEQRQILRGELQLNKMERLKSLIENHDLFGTVLVSFEGDQDFQSLFIVKSSFETEIPVLCQRCLHPINYHVTGQVTLSPVQSFAQIEALPSEYVPLKYFEQKAFSLLELIEDELILSLPIIPKHSEGECRLTSQAVEMLRKAQEDVDTPFAKLNVLKKEQ